MTCCRYLGVASVGSAAHRDNSLSTEPGVPVPPICSSLTGLVPSQLNVCRHSPAAVLSVGLGAHLGLLECQYQFQHERWNCSPAARHINQSVFDDIVRRGQCRNLNAGISKGRSSPHYWMVYSFTLVLVLRYNIVVFQRPDTVKCRLIDLRCRLTYLLNIQHKCPSCDQRVLHVKCGNILMQSNFQSVCCDSATGEIPRTTVGRHKRVKFTASNC